MHKALTNLPKVKEIEIEMYFLWILSKVKWIILEVHGKNGALHPNLPNIILAIEIAG